MSKLHLISLGCNKNLVDSEIMLGRLRNFELTNEISDADVIIVNTCGFIASAKEESVRTILEMAEAKKQGATLVVTGCLMQRYREELMRELPEVDLFTGVGDYDKIDEIILKKQNLFSPDVYLQSNEERIITGSNYHAYIKIAEGCNQKCSFCAIPTFKGKLKSRSLENIIDEVKRLVQKGYYDFSFLSQDSSSWMRDNGVSDGLISLIDEVEKINGVKSARILYLYPSTTTMALIDRIVASPVFHNYFDMPIQHISDKMLRVMKRGSNEAKVREILSAMRSTPNSFLRTGVIVGHPGESDEDFDSLCKFLEEFKFDRISAFAYSREEDTAAFDMEQIPTKIISKRLSKIEKVIKKTLDDSFRLQIGREIIASIEGESSEGEMFFGGKMDVWDKDIDGEILINESDERELEVGARYLCEVTDSVDNKLIARVIKRA
ncbi:30S ribosomal protein S12 methylthiotransferase RimO [Campylobacter sp. RM9344]|uniref:Ribosomal protein uS12 methylthiotransferase RimO n=1 Tax=Campylobacter californiensis TaxID=1032243 RepID=A0AAW3ZT69_9BACT|nr:MULTISPECIES: 30S ribosomal protein S12 methylthiotransferase RimO [unclassified Campylobacter]MBE2984002.1 30S ribosomal protein S12 methylthiotransferase RimO [Campylobacter sp. RM6883]MBE2994540.1 30S ribosomal protein S12 methylthiotransferase RimO [Campylobacter sp. RM6913]MBE3030075.1 30S ribosomal protein S12 methylthiotransferase RimO [Campylobacter sp. RM9344]MBE3607737.1 30S ribosomal protein S12 methylthiotransferase RimO [Campylobacter sp. RM9337]QCD51129.1 radical SAM methylthi